MASPEGEGMRTVDDRPYKSSAPYTFPRGEGGTAIAVTDEECGR